MSDDELNKLFAELAADDLLDDRREYTVEDLQSAYTLNAADAQTLYEMIQAYFAPSVTFELRKVPKMTEAEQAAYRQAHPDKAAATDAMLDELRKQYPEVFVSQPTVSSEPIVDQQHQQVQPQVEVVQHHPVKSKNGDMFKYSSYWHTWSRVLKPMRDNPMRGNQVELDLTSHSSVHWSRVSMLNVRKHCTAPHASDKLVAELPAEVVAEMTQMLGAELVERLLHEDVLPQIDWQAYERACNGGCPLEFCSK